MTTIAPPPTVTTPPLAPANTYPLPHPIAMITIAPPPTAITPPLAPASTHPYRR